MLLPQHERCNFLTTEEIESTETAIARWETMIFSSLSSVLSVVDS
jgi:hypothetical protein